MSIPSIFLEIQPQVASRTLRFKRSAPKAKYDWLKTFLKLPNGIPSHDTFGNVFSVINPNEFEERFLNWIRSFCIRGRKRSIVGNGLAAFT